MHTSHSTLVNEPHTEGANQTQNCNKTGIHVSHNTGPQIQLDAVYEPLFRLELARHFPLSLSSIDFHPRL